MIKIKFKFKSKFKSKNRFDLNFKRDPHRQRRETGSL